MIACPQCGTLFVGRDADKGQMRASLAELEEGEQMSELVLGGQRKTIAALEAENLVWQDESLNNLIRAGEAEAERDRLRKGLRLIIDRPPGQAHRIAIQMLEPREGGKG